jgi:hypothetical protein
MEKMVVVSAGTLVEFVLDRSQLTQTFRLRPCGKKNNGGTL